MRRLATVVTTISLAMAGMIFSPVQAAVPVDGDYVCTTGFLKSIETTNLYTVTTGSVTSHSSGKCSGAVVIPSGVTSVGQHAFLNASALTSITIPSSVITIGAGAFQGTSALTSITIPSSVTTIGVYAFVNASSLTSITVDGANANYSSTDGVLFNKNTTTLISYPGGKTDASYVIPSSVTTIQAYAFHRANSLTSITLPDGLQAIHDSAFRNATSLISIAIPSSVTSIGSLAFNGATSLTSITVDGVNANFSSTDGVLFNKNITNLISYPEGKTDASYVIPASTIIIRSEAFQNVSSLTSVTFESDSQLTSIGQRAFYSATALISITLPEGVTTIGDYAFYGATSLTSITIPSSVDSIGSLVFYQTSLASFTVLAESEFFSSTAGVLFNKNITTLISYPVGKSGASYVIPSGVTSIGQHAFVQAPALTSITIPSSVTTIGSEAFQDTSALTSITIPASVNSIGDNAFVSAVSLTKVYFLGNAPASIADSAFENIGLYPKAYIKLGATGFAKAGSTWKGLTIAIVDQRAVSTVKPKVTGTAKVGKTLKVNKGTWTGSPIPKYKYQWYYCRTAVTAARSTVPSNCKKVSRATGTSLKLAKAQKGKYITVLVTGTSTGTTKTTWLSKSTGKVK
jgi:hypothetical protein